MLVGGQAPLHVLRAQRLHHAVPRQVAGPGAGELAAQARRYRSFRFEAVDNIMDMAYLTEAVPELIASGATLRHLLRGQGEPDPRRSCGCSREGGRDPDPARPGVAEFPRAGADAQGVRAAQNVNVLRWGRYYGIDGRLEHHLGLPRRDREDYAEQAAVMPHLVHLQPPVGAGRVWMERFSPLFTHAPVSAYGAAERSYRLCLPGGFDLGRVAYSSSTSWPNPLPDDAYAGVRDAVAAGRRPGRVRTPPVLDVLLGARLPADLRRPALPGQGTYTFEGALAEIYLACVDRPRSPPQPCIANSASPCRFPRWQGFRRFGSTG